MAMTSPRPEDSFEARLAKARQSISSTLTELKSSKQNVLLAVENQKKMPHILDDLEQIAYEAKSNFEFKQSKVHDKLFEMALFGTGERFTDVEIPKTIGPQNVPQHVPGCGAAGPLLGGSPPVISAGGSSILAGKEKQKSTTAGAKRKQGAGEPGPAAAGAQAERPQPTRRTSRETSATRVVRFDLDLEEGDGECDRCSPPPDPDVGGGGAGSGSTTTTTVSSSSSCSEGLDEVQFARGSAKLDRLIVKQIERENEEKVLAKGARCHTLT